MTFSFYLICLFIAIKDGRELSIKIFARNATVDYRHLSNCEHRAHISHRCVPLDRIILSTAGQ